MFEADPRTAAAAYFRQAYEQQMAGEYQQAIEFYTRSIEAFPTAEAYTFRGWTYSFLGDYNRAIAECLEAIKVDPEFGNPYNDIGAYLIEQGKWEEAIPWLEKATACETLRSSRLSPFQFRPRVRAQTRLGEGERVLRAGVRAGTDISGGVGGAEETTGHVQLILFAAGVRVFAQRMAAAISEI